MSDAGKIKDPIFGQMFTPGPGVVSPLNPPVIKPRINRKTEFMKILKRWEENPVSKIKSSKSVKLEHALDGIRVLDLSRIIAGPCAARTLSEFGAEVVSLQSETRLDWALSFHLVFNAGKKSVTLDFKTDEGKKKLWSIMKEFKPDVFIQNYRHLDLAKEIGIHPDDVFKKFPNMAYTYLNAYGNEGIWKDRPGFEQVVQAVSGIQIAYAKGKRPKLLPSPIIDIGCGLLGSFGTLLALYNEKKTKKGTFVTTHLTTMSVLLQIMKISEFQRDKCIENAVNKRKSFKYNKENELLSEIFLTLSGPACLSGPRKDIQKWMLSAGLIKNINSIKDKELHIISNHFFMHSVSHWQQTIVDAGLQNSIGLITHPKISKIINDIKKYNPGPVPIVRKRDFSGSSKKLTFVGNPVKMSKTPLKNISTPPMRGSDTKEFMNMIKENTPDNEFAIPYPADKPLASWLVSIIRWGYFAWKSGNI